jgi:hypothetical protein
MKLKVYDKKNYRLCIEKYDDLIFCCVRTSQAWSVCAPKNSVIMFSHTKSIDIGPQTFKGKRDGI